MFPDYKVIFIRGSMWSLYQRARPGEDLFRHHLIVAAVGAVADKGSENQRYIRVSSNRDGRLRLTCDYPRLYGHDWAVTSCVVVWFWQ